MKPSRLLFLSLVLAILPLRAKENAPAPFANDPAAQAQFTVGMNQLAGLFQAKDSEQKTFSATIEIGASAGVASELRGQQFSLKMQAPDKILIAGKLLGEEVILGRDGQRAFVWARGKNFAVAGEPGLPKYRTNPTLIDDTVLGSVALIPAEQLQLLPLLCAVQTQPAVEIGGVKCKVVRALPMPEALKAANLPNLSLMLAMREGDSMPLQITIAKPDGSAPTTVTFRDPKFEATAPAAVWAIPSEAAAKAEKVPLVQLRGFFGNLTSMLLGTGGSIPTLGPVTGEKKLVATHGAGRLEMHDGTRVLFLKGTPEEMGEQHGKLLKREIRGVVGQILYGVGVGSSFEKGRWFFGEIEDCQARIGKFIDPRYLREMDAIAAAAGLDKEEIRLANFFPELFHCSGFAIAGAATKGGRIYHGRVLDYLKGVGLEQNAVVIIMQPEQGYAWANVSYAGFVGSVTAMNEKQISIGEMGGRGEGNWDGKPMAQLLREVMEKASTLDEAVAILRESPRTCEYYYVIADGKTKQSVGVKATPAALEIVKPGEAHEQLPTAVKDSVLLSAGDRYTELVRRVQAGFGKFDDTSARDLMTRPVCMGSNIHSVLFAPDTLDFWVANADSKDVASHTRYTHYNLAKLLKAAPAAK